MSFRRTVLRCRLNFQGTLMLCMGIFLLTFIMFQSFMNRAIEYASTEQVNIVVINDKIMHQIHNITGKEEQPHFHLHHLYAETTNFERAGRMPSHGVPRIMHYIWCETGSFTFNHFLSVLSVIRIMVPDSIYLYYEEGNYPKLDATMYNTWLEELRYNYPWLITQPQPNVTQLCINGKPNEGFVVAKLRQHGGAFMAPDVFLIDFEEVFTPFDFVLADEGDGSFNILGSMPNFPKEIKTIHDLRKNSRNANVPKCEAADETANQLHRYPCLLVRKPLFPETLLREESENVAIFRYLRKLFYGAEAIPRLQPQMNEVVPNVGHYVWFGGGKMDYVFYLSVLSALYVVKVETVYIHGDKPPSGRYWEQLMRDEPTTVKWTYRQYPHEIYKSYVGRVEHAADVARHDIMLKYGGINMDADVIFNRELDKKLYHYDTVVTLDNYLFAMDPFPNTFNLGVVMSKPHSKFWQLYQFSERYYYEDDYTWNSNRVPYKIWERNPGLVYIEPKLQVICSYLKCYPTWVETLREAHELSRHLDTWKQIPMSFHWTWPAPNELENEQQMRVNNSIFAQIGHNVLKKAGKW